MLVQFLSNKIVCSEIQEYIFENNSRFFGNIADSGWPVYLKFLFKIIQKMPPHTRMCFKLINMLSALYFVTCIWAYISVLVMKRVFLLQLILPSRDKPMRGHPVFREQFLIKVSYVYRLLNSYSVLGPNSLVGI